MLRGVGRANKCERGERDEGEGTVLPNQVDVHGRGLLGWNRAEQPASKSGWEFCVARKVFLLCKNQKTFLVCIGNRMGRVKLRINIPCVFRNCRNCGNCPSRAATRAIPAKVILILNFTRKHYLFMTYGAKFLSKLGISKAVSFTSKNTRSPETAKFSVVAKRSEQVKAYDCYKLLIIKTKSTSSYSLTKHNLQLKLKTSRFVHLHQCVL